MAESLDVVARSPQEAHKYLQHAWEVIAKPLTLQSVPVHIRVCEAELNRSVEANKYYWGIVLKEISEQACIDGQRWSVDAWHELFKRQFLGYEIKKIKVAGKKKTYVKRQLKSTAKQKIKPFSVYLDKVIAFAVTDLSVQFSEDWFE